MTIIRDWKTEILSVVEAREGPHDPQTRPWAKIIERVDTHSASSSTFIGDVLSGGRTELPARSQVILVMTARRFGYLRVKTYNIVTMDADGALTLTGIRVDDPPANWALRIRGRVAALIETIEGENHDEPRSPRDRGLS